MHLGESLERGQLTLLAREETESQGWDVLGRVLIGFQLVSAYNMVAYPSIRVLAELISPLKLPRLSVHTTEGSTRLSYGRTTALTVNSGRVDITTFIW